MKKFFSMASFLLLTISGLGLAACSGGGTESSEAPSSETSSETSSESSSDTSVAPPTPEEIVEEYCKLSNATLKATTTMTMEQDLTETAKATSLSTILTTTKLTTSKYSIYQEYSNYDIAYPYSYLKSSFSWADTITDDEIKTQLATMLNNMKRSTQDTYTVTINRDGMVTANFTYTGEPIQDGYIYYDDVAKQYYSFDGSAPYDGGYLLDSEYSNYMFQYSISSYKSVLLKLYKNGTYDAATKTYSISGESEEEIGTSKTKVKNPSLVVDDNNKPVKLTIHSETSPGGVDSTKVPVDYILEVSNVGSTSITLPTHQKVDCDHKYQGLVYEKVDENKCRPYCKHCHKYLSEAVAHHYEEGGSICTACGHMKGVEDYINEGVEYYFKGKDEHPLKKDANNKIYANALEVEFRMRTKHDADAYLGDEPVRDNEDHIIYRITMAYVSIDKQLVYYKTGLEEVMAGSHCVRAKANRLAVIDNIDITFADPENKNGTLRELAKLTPEAIKEAYSGSTLTTSAELTEYHIVHSHTAETTEETKLDDLRTGCEYTCQYCGFHYDGGISSEGYVIHNPSLISKPENFSDPRQDEFIYVQLPYEYDGHYCAIIDPATNPVPVNHAHYFITALKFNIDTGTIESNNFKFLTQHVNDEHGHCAICGHDRLVVEDTNYFIYIDKASLDFEHDTAQLSLVDGSEARALNKVTLDSGTYMFKFKEDYYVKATKSGNTVTLTVIQYGRERGTVTYTV